MSDNTLSDDIVKLNEFIANISAGNLRNFSGKLESGKLDETLALVDNLRLMLAELAVYTRELSGGNLGTDMPPRKNYIAAGVKALHTQLNHIAWQAGQIAKGDYAQVVDYMGELSDAFNGMSEQLKNRQNQIIMQQESLMRVFNAIDTLVLVYSEDLRTVYFVNDIAKELIIQSDSIYSSQPSYISGIPLYQLIALAAATATRSRPESIYDEAADRWYRIEADPIDWNAGDKAILVTCTDITKFKKSEIELVDRATTDAMTKSLNRDAGLSHIKSLLAEMGENDLFTLCYLDRDELKDINDNHGHPEGDEVIIAFSEIVRSEIRESDLFIRMGGDEFAILFKNQLKTASEHILKRIQMRINEYNCRSGKPFKLSFSHGFFEVVGLMNLTYDQVVRFADEDMYEKKKKKKAHLAT